MTKAFAVVIAALSPLAGCSLLFDMDPYDRGGSSGRSTSSSSGGTRDDGGERDDGGSPSPDAGGDGATPACMRETESNDVEAMANPLPIGETCGELSNPGDEDWFLFTSTATVRLEMVIPVGARLEVFRDGSSSPQQSYTGSGGTVSSPAGVYRLRVSGVAGPPGPRAYTFERQ